MDPQYIAALEIGSSKIKGIVAAVDATAAITVLAVEECPTGGNVRYGRVQNAREVSDMADDIIRRLENRPGITPNRISSIFVANGGRSLSSAQAEATIRQGGDAEVTPLTLERLHKEARFNLATDAEVLAIAPRKYTTDGTEVKKIVGSFGNAIHGEFTFLTCSPENVRNLDRVKITSHGQEIHREVITRLLAQCEMALTDSDRQLGCLFIDFGAETTTLAVFRDGALQLASTLPMGSYNITRDLSVGLSTTEDSAENIKINKGIATAERIALETPDLETREIINFVSARSGEIIANIVHRLNQGGFKPADLPGGIIITGGGSRLRGFNEMLESQTHMKVRPAAVDRSIRMAVPGAIAADNFDVIALVKYAAAHTDTNCLTRTTETTHTEVTGNPGRPIQPGTRKNVGLDDPDLLKDDEMDEELDQPANINGGGDDLPPQGKTADETRKSLLERFKNWLRPETDDIDEEDDDNLDK